MIPAISAVRSLVGAMTFEETFSTAFGPHTDPALSIPRWTPHYYFGDPNGVSSRQYSGTISTMLDGKFDPSSFALQSNGAVVMLAGYKLSPADAIKYNNHRYAGAAITTQHSFAQTYGYFEISAKLPDCAGTRPAFWMMPTAKTPFNGGRLAEIDIFEHWAGPWTIMSGNNPVLIDRVARPLSTLHTLGPDNKEAPPISNAGHMPDKIDLIKFHTFGCLWMPNKMSFFVDQVETLTITDPAVLATVNDPHYMVLSLDVLNEGDPDKNGKFPAYYMIDYARAWSLA